ncbi:NADH-quinone oxidoreductase subunit NuoK [Campylobacter sp. JMF_08 NE1]|uniref:NADH-quinone oxidoreductase subunit NuoK n=1 Tax=Campylobacter sp. JMF_08 NE1 TaxID=2983821 RepID=UPI0022E9ABD2|nr:NADH-quinone oxidoreductase subunit NuoK [Campylobacter sp. JMF_08 NE1]MDA3047799.1 NADH-quinone oxidoreductase subunit NuoK [Campylobacter sp. JMF_08 NE1]
MSLNHYLIVASLMFVLGLVGVMKRQNLIMLFFSTEILLNSANLALVAIAKFHQNLNGEIFALFIIAIAASEIAVGLALLILWYKKTGSIETDSFVNFKIPRGEKNA